MSGPTDDGIADDADAYLDEELGRAPEPARGVAEDASAFAQLLDEPSSPEVRGLGSRWLYRQDGAVFGPVSAKELLEHLYAGDVDAETPVAPEDQEFRPLRHYGAFREHLGKAEEAARVRAAAAARAKAEAKAQRARRLRGLAIAGLVVLVGSGAVYGVVSWRRSAAAAAEKARREQAIEAELAALLEGVSIEPPLLPLVEEPPPETPAQRRARRRRGGKRAPTRAVSRTGVLSEREVHLGLQKGFGGFVSCIKAQLKRDPGSVPETVVLRFHIDNEGRAGAVSFADRFLRKSPMQGCFTSAIGRVRWRAFEGEVRNVEYPITVRRPS